MNNCIIIPARYNSKRLPGKPLIKLIDNLLIGETIKNLKKKIDIKNIFCSSLSFNTYYLFSNFLSPTLVED